MKKELGNLQSTHTKSDSKAKKTVQVKPGCFITKSCCPKEGVECTESSTPQTHRDVYGEKHKNSNVNMESCLRRAREVYQYCQSALQVRATFGAVSRAFPLDCKKFPCSEMPP